MLRDWAHLRCLLPRSRPCKGSRHETDAKDRGEEIYCYIRISQRRAVVEHILYHAPRHCGLRYDMVLHECRLAACRTVHVDDRSRMIVRAEVTGKLAAFKGIIAFPAPIIGGILFQEFGFGAPPVASAIGAFCALIMIIKFLPREG